MKFLPKLTLHEYIAIVATIAGLILAYQANKLSETQLKLSKSQSKLAELQARALEFKLSPYLLMKMNPEDEAKEKGTWAEISNEGGIALNLIIDSRVVVSVECYKKNTMFDGINLSAPYDWTTQHYWRYKFDILRKNEKYLFSAFGDLMLKTDIQNLRKNLKERKHKNFKLDLNSVSVVYQVKYTDTIQQEHTDYFDAVYSEQFNAYIPYKVKKELIKKYEELFITDQFINFINADSDKNILKKCSNIVPWSGTYK